MSIHLKRLSDVAVVTPEGQFWGYKETDDLKEQFQALIAEGNQDLVIDLGKVQHLNSIALGVLVSVHTNYAKRGARAILCNVDKQIKNLFVIARLTLVFEIRENLEEALAAFA